MASLSAGSPEVETSSKSASVKRYGIRGASGPSPSAIVPSRCEMRRTGRLRSRSSTIDGPGRGAISVSRTVPPVSVVSRSRTTSS
jgi:hypothetical protein